MGTGKLLSGVLSVWLLSICAVCQTTLSTNSGINSADTWAVFDITVQSNATLNLPEPIYNPTTQTSSNVFTASPALRTFHVEAGYDPNGSLVMNLAPSGGGINPNNTDASAIGFFRYAGGQITIFDQNGNPIPLALPNTSLPPMWPLTLMGSNPGSSVINGLVIPNIQQYALQAQAKLDTNSKPGTAYMTMPTSTENGSANFTYVQSGTNWVIQQAVINPNLTNGTGSRTITFANVMWNDNPTNDAARAALGSTVLAHPLQTTTAPPAAAPFASNTAYTNDGRTITPSDCNTHLYNLGGPQNVVLQHGLNSSSCTWTRMANWLNQKLLFGQEVIPSLNSSDGLASQGRALANTIQSSQVASPLLIGHSQGGLISRYAAQQMLSNPDIPSYWPSGIVTVNTPHQGANFALNGPAALGFGLMWFGQYLWDVIGCSSEFDNIGCYVAVLLYAAGGTAQTWLDAAQPALADLTPGSPFLQNLNSPAQMAKEPAAQAAVIGYTPQRWLVTRVATEWVVGAVCPGPGPSCCNPEDGCGERNVAAATEYFYDAVTSFLVFEIIEGYFTGDWNWDAIYYLSDILLVMDVTDLYYDILIDVPGDWSSDGLVQGPSQYYPTNSAVQYQINGADSHSAALKSDHDRDTLDSALAQQFHVPTLASCTFAPSIPNFSLFAAGGTGTFNVATQSGCPWSAVSDAPWLTITSGINGTSSGSVSFSVAANPFNVPRAGHINIGDGLATTSVNVKQYAPCAYALSQGPVVAIPPSGGTYIVSVNTQDICPWSVVSNASWLTIIAGASGTGPGSFTYTAAPNSGSSDMSGTIAVMNQTLAVVLGSPVGTPGTATVTISGTEKITSKIECPNGPDGQMAGPSGSVDTSSNKSGGISPDLPCCGCVVVSVADSGTVSIIVNGYSTSVYYTRGATATSIATALTNALNYPLSPISATLSGTTITLTSTVKGTGTNYPLATSVTFDASDFSAPSFSAVPSGSHLTGGTD